MALGLHKQPYPHYWVYLPTQGTIRMHERRWAVCMHSQTRKGRTQPNAVHGGGRQNQQPRQSSHPNRRNAGDQRALQQCDLHKGWVPHDNGYLQLLPHDTFASWWIHLNQIKWHPRWGHQQIQAQDKATKNSSIYIRAKHGMYSLPQAGLLANELLKKGLNKHGYQQSKLVTGLWKHNTQPKFTLVVDEFGMKYIVEKHSQHLKMHLKNTTNLCAIGQAKGT